MRKFHFTIIISFLTANLSLAQNCDCNSNFEWVKKTFEENDAGFQYIIDKKGEAAYHIHNQLILEKIKTAKTLKECTYIIKEWSKFFRTGHFGIGILTPKTPDTNTSQNVTQTVQEAETWKVDIPQFEKYISKKKEVDFEGIWEIGNYKVGIKKEGVNYIGFIIESSVDTWKPKHVKLKIEENGGKLKSTYYMRDHSPDECGEPLLIENNYLQLGRWTLKRLQPIFPTDPFVENYFNAMDAKKPYLEELNATTLYLRIPSFGMKEKDAIDSVITANTDIISRTENLIIDLRNNGGGSSNSFNELLPFLYTNPTRMTGIEFLSTKQNNQRFLDFATNDEFNEETRQWYKESYDELQKKLGEFVNLGETAIHINSLDTIYEYPKHVGIIIHKENGSATEHFILIAKQSKKVKLFGTTTYGAFDISNMYSIKSPCEEFELRYALSRNMSMYEMPIDDIGFQPDYFLDKSIPPYKWVEFVNEILNGK